MFYLDASAAVAALTREAHSEQVWRWLDAHTDPIFYSGWVTTEVSSALSLKVRTGALSVEDRAIALQNWRRLREDNFAEIVIAPDAFETAARFCDQAGLGLRGGDALHLAIAQSAATNLVTFDRRMAEAALHFGVPVERL